MGAISLQLSKGFKLDVNSMLKRYRLPHYVVNWCGSRPFDCILGSLRSYYSCCNENKRRIKIELCVRLSVLRLVHVAWSRCTEKALSIAWHEWFSRQGKDKRWPDSTRLDLARRWPAVCSRNSIRMKWRHRETNNNTLMLLYSPQWTRTFIAKSKESCCN